MLTFFDIISTVLPAPGRHSSSEDYLPTFLDYAGKQDDSKRSLEIEFQVGQVYPRKASNITLRDIDLVLGSEFSGLASLHHLPLLLHNGVPMIVGWDDPQSGALMDDPFLGGLVCCNPDAT